MDMRTPPGCTEPMPASTDMATASAARTLMPLMVGPGLEAGAGGEGPPRWMTAAGDPRGSAGGSSAAPAAGHRHTHIHPKSAAFFCMSVTGQSL